ncbi:Fc.00g057370.m01.CDS01 [Cosmosporella sp. VM-42]
MSMLSVQVTEWGTAPKPVQSIPPAAPVDDSTVQIRLIAAGLHQVVRSRAVGRHYSASSLPHTLGIDGVGVEVSSGKQVYFTTVGSRCGSFAQIVNVNKEDVEVLPEGVDAVQAAALVNPVMSSWMALSKRVDLPEGRPWTAFVMGVTSVSGRLAVKVARAFGATKVIGAARNEGAMKTLGLDAYIVLKDPISTTDFSAAVDADVVLDYLAGPYMGAYLGSSRGRKPLSWVCVGGLSGQAAELPSEALRKRDLTIRGSGPVIYSRIEQLIDKRLIFPRVLLLGQAFFLCFKSISRDIVVNPLKPHLVLAKADPNKELATTTSTEKNWRLSLQTVTTKRLSLWGVFLDKIQLNLSANREHIKNSKFTMTSLDTIYLSEDPPIADIKSRCNHPDIREYMRLDSALCNPVYMVTGIKVAKGFKLEGEKGSSKGLEGDVGGELSPEASVGIGAGASTRTSVGDEFEADGDVIFAYQLMKIKPKGWRKDKTFKMSEYQPRQAFLSNESMEDDEVEVETGEVSSEDLEGLRRAQVAESEEGVVAFEAIPKALI